MWLCSPTLLVGLFCCETSDRNCEYDGRANWRIRGNARPRSWRPCALHVGRPRRCPRGRAAAQARARGRTRVTDEMGRDSENSRNRCSRIVSLAPNLTETLFALGLGDRSGGRHGLLRLSARGEGASRTWAVRRTPTWKQSSRCIPDLVLATRSINRAGDGRRARTNGHCRFTPAIRTRCETCSIRSRAWRALMGAAQQGRGAGGATCASGSMRSALRGCRDRPPVHVLFVVWPDPLITIGRNTFHCGRAAARGSANRWSDTAQNWPQLSLEEVVRLQPDYFVFASGHTAEIRSRDR